MVYLTFSAGRNKIIRQTCWQFIKCSSQRVGAGEGRTITTVLEWNWMCSDLKRMEGKLFTQLWSSDSHVTPKKIPYLQKSDFQWLFNQVLQLFYKLLIAMVLYYSSHKSAVSQKTLAVLQFLYWVLRCLYISRFLWLLYYLYQMSSV